MSGHGRLIQAGFVVDDLNSAIGRWLKTANIGPFYIMRNVRPENGIYRGKPAPLEMDIAFAQAGPMQIELIQPLSPGPSMYRDSVPKGQDGFHHVCYFTDDIDGEFERFRVQDVPVAYQATFGQMRFAYFDTRAKIGCMTEVMEHDPIVEGMFEMIAQASIGWDGRNPIRSVE